MHRSVSITLLILLPALPAAAGEIAIAPVREAPATLSQSIASGASDGNDFLFVWSDVTHGSYDCRAARVTREGVVLDRGGIPVPAYKRNSVVWTGTSYLILWDKKDFPDETHSLGVYGLRLGRDGTILGGPRVIKEKVSISSVVSNGTHVVVEYRTDADERHALFLDSEANIVTDVFLGNRDNVSISSMAWNGTHFVAAWVYSPDWTHTSATLEAIRFDIHGTLDAAPRQLLSDATTAFDDAFAIASDGNSFLLVTHRNNGRDYAQRMSPDLRAIGAPQEQPWLHYGDEDYYKTDYSSSIFWNGSNYLRFAYSLGTISVVQMDRDGRTIRTDVVTNLGAGGSVVTPVATTNGRDFFVGWTEFPTPYAESSDVFGALVSVSTLQSRARTLLSIAPAEQKRPLVASGGTNLLTVWEEGAAVYARRLAIDGSTLDAVPLRLAESGTPKALVFNGSDYFAFWSSTTSRKLEITHLPRDGMLRTDGGATLPDTEILGAASDGVVTLLVSKTGSKLQATRILADGSLAGTVTLDSGGFGKADIAAGNGEFLVVWETSWLTDTGYYVPTLDYQVHGARLSSSLALLDTAAFNISPDRAYETEPAAAWNGREWLVVWRSCFGYTAYAPCELRGRRVPRSGVPQADDSGTVIAKNGSLPSVTSDGNRYALTWWDSYSATTVHAGFLADLGLPLTGELQIQQYPSDWSPLRLVPVRPGMVATAYSREMPDATYGEVTRAFVNLLTLPAPDARRRAVK